MTKKFTDWCADQIKQCIDAGQEFAKWLFELYDETTSAIAKTYV